MNLFTPTFLGLLAATSLLAQTTADVASNYTNWTDGSNQGSGFTSWDLSDNNNDPGNNVFAGYFLGDSTNGAADINTGGQSFGIFANPGSAFANATRDFATPLSVNDIFSVDLALNFDNGNKGFSLRGGGSQIFNFNVGSGASVNTDFTDNLTTATYDYGGDALIQAVIEVISASALSYDITRTSDQGTQGTLYSGTVTGITQSGIPQSIESVEFYNSGTDDSSAQNNLYFNNLSVVPEPSVTALLIGAFAALTVLHRRR